MAGFLVALAATGILMGSAVSTEGQDAKSTVQSANEVVWHPYIKADSTLSEVQERRDQLKIQASRDEERQLIKYRERKAEARAEARAAARAEAEAEAVTNAETQPSGSGSSNLPDLLLLIRSCESGHHNADGSCNLNNWSYTAFNSTGCEGYGCYGAYQLHGSYMDDWAREAGYGQYAGTPATQWPPSVQDAVALFKFNQTGGSLWCDWADYC